MGNKSSFLDKVLSRIGRLDEAGLQTVVQRLARERSFLETLFNTIEDGVLVVDETGRILYFNQAVTRFLGLQPSVEGQPITNFIPELEWDKIRRFDSAGGSGVVRHEFEVQYPRPRFLRLYAAPLDGQTAGSAGVALILHDATEARQKTIEAIESERTQALTQLAASVAHELGNPLNALHIHLQLMERELKKLRAGTSVEPRGKSGSGRHLRARAAAGAGDSDARDIVPKLEQYLSVARGEIDRLDYIITQFLHAIRPTLPQLKLVSLNDVVHKTLELLRPELDNRGLNVRTRLAVPIPVTPIDPTQIQQVLVNLIKNALQAMTKGGTLTLQTGEGSDGVWVSVADTGGGIPQEQINRIFEPFYTTKKKGTGLGLKIVQRIVRAHGGRIELESQVGRGTTFRIWLPLHERKPRLLEAPMHD
ncbi:MAG TPA: ATP-binding protein [Candidatus Paceibacterota bacterium]|nr:ATP-binding protein [Verrucomicrobiota bacterium]HSA10133.1 ATP-binding protein [Candidatus Paceibacterota bacterium]